MLIRSLRSFSTIEALKSIKSQSHTELEKTTKSFMDSYKSFISANSEDIYCYSLKLTPSQTTRCELLSEELLNLTPQQHRAFFYLLQDYQKRDFNYKPMDRNNKNTGNSLWTEDIWPSIHPSNLSFQQEIDSHGLIGAHGFPQKFLDELAKGNLKLT